MSYVKGQLSKVYDELESGITYWLYWTSDSLATVLGAGYISDATDRRLKLGDVVDVFVGTLTNFASSTGGQTLGNATFSPTVGIASRFTAAPTWAKCQVSTVGAPTTTTPGAASLTLIDLIAGAAQYANPRNLIDGGDFTTNPWQRGTTFSNITGTIVYTADRFFVVGGDITNNTVSARAAKVAYSNTVGFNQAFRFGRTANASSLSSITAGQILETNDSIRTQGQQVTLSFWAASEANYSGGALGVTLFQGTGTDQGAASGLAGTWTSETNVISSTQAITSAMTRYQFTGTVSSATTQLGVSIGFTPTGSAGAADTVLLQGVQLEVGPQATPFEHRDVELDLALCQRYCFVVNEPASGIGVSLAASTASNKFAITVPLPTPMRVAPTVTVANGSFGFQLANAYLAGSSLAAGVGHTTVALNLTQLATVASNNAAQFVGGGGAGSIVASAEY